MTNRIQPILSKVDNTETTLKSDGFKVGSAFIYIFTIGALVASIVIPVIIGEDVSAIGILASVIGGFILGLGISLIMRNTFIKGCKSRNDMVKQCYIEITDDRIRGMALQSTNPATMLSVSSNMAYGPYSIQLSPLNLGFRQITNVEVAPLKIGEYDYSTCCVIYVGNISYALLCLDAEEAAGFQTRIIDYLNK